MGPWNLCRHRLHKFAVWIRACKLGHVFQIPHRVPGAIWKGLADICGEIINKFISPRLVFVDITADAVIQQNQISINMYCRASSATW